MLLPADHFLGFVVRFEMLSKHGEFERLLREIKHLYTHMLKHGPGTIWEGLSGWASVCQGFGSHAGVWLVRDFLGLHIPDAVDGLITIAPHPCGIKWAKGSVKTDSGVASVNWCFEQGVFRLYATIPPGYKADLILPDEIGRRQHVTVDGNSATERDGAIRGLSDSFTVTVIEEDGGKRA